MRINYILSETSCGATSASVKEIIKKAESDLMSNVIVIVPEPKSIAIERELLDASSGGAFANVFVYSFMRLLSRIGGVNETEIVSKQTCVMLIRQIILENLDKLSCYKKTAKTVGFAEKIYDFFKFNLKFSQRESAGLYHIGNVFGCNHFFRLAEFFFQPKFDLVDGKVGKF